MQDLNARWGTATQLQVTVTCVGPTCEVRLDGALDMVTVPRLREAVDPACEGRYRLVVIDLGGLRFLSLGGLDALVDAHQALERAGCRLVLTNPDASTTRVLATTGLDQVLQLVSEAEHARA